MVRIRLKKIGDGFRIVAADRKCPRDGRFLEVLGTYKPKLATENPERVKINLEAVKAWISKGAQPSDRIKKLMEKFSK